MSHVWKPTTLGRLLSRAPKWSITADGEGFVLNVDGDAQRFTVTDDRTLSVRRGLIWSRIFVQAVGAAEHRLAGLPNAKADTLSQSLAAILAEIRTRADVERLRKASGTVRSWLQQVDALARRSSDQHRWITREDQGDMIGVKPVVDVQHMRALMQRPDVRERIGSHAHAFSAELDSLESDWPATWRRLNEALIQRELKDCAALLESVESKPLTEEQARSVLTFDNRLLVIAAAGSGKTSTMVAKAAYAIHRGLVHPDRIVMLAFNKKAAAELQERATAAFGRLGLADLGVKASTFHALGLGIIGQATGRKPDIPDWATDAGEGIKKLQAIVDRLKDTSEQYRSQWDLFRLVFGRPLQPFGQVSAPDAWNVDGHGRITTLQGERVRSTEEAWIANFLFYNGVNYQYERAYKFNTATAERGQYYPDFYYPDIDLYHEHFALDAKGQPPAHFVGYLEGVQWKRNLHKQRGTELIETTSHLLRTGPWMAQLTRLLSQRGLKLEPNPDRPIPDEGVRPMDNIELAALIRTFMSHAKSNNLKPAILKQRVDALPDGADKARHQIFVDLAVPVMDAWDAALAAEGGIDFEDMLNMAAEHVEQGRYEAPYELVMADEFQDASRARARLCRALVARRGRHFFAVGDDWQSINRFAGADVSVMTKFTEWFGPSPVLKLEQTFRCPQELCDVTSKFVGKNPAQFVKTVRSVTVPVGPVIRALEVGRRDKIRGAITRFLDELHQGLLDGPVPPGRRGPVSVMLLGRYNADKVYMPNPERYQPQMSLNFLTVHRSKGAEADYVLLPAMVSPYRGNGFPNTRSDDPVLSLAMPSGDDFPHGEERRLLYVAMTRARRGVTMFTVQGQRSVFVRELVEEHGLEVTDTDGEVIKSKHCPACEQGVIVTRNGPYGAFESCSGYPVCEYKPARSGRAATPHQRFGTGIRRR